MNEHEVSVYAEWCNDGTADLVIWCGTCVKEIAAVNNRDDGEISPERIAELVAEHKALS